MQLVLSLDGKNFETDSSTKGIEYFVSDIQIQNEERKAKAYRLIWLFEGEYLEIIGVINAFRISKIKK